MKKTTSLALALAFASTWLVACPSSPPPRAEPGDVTVPKMPPVSAAPAPSAARDPGAIVRANASDHGWHQEGDQHQPPYVPSEELASKLQAAAKSGHAIVGTVAERIEECSGMGGSHVLIETRLGLVHFGGHGVTFGPDPTAGQVVLLAIEKLPAPKSIENAGFCVPARTIVAEARVVLVVPNERDAERIIEDLSKAPTRG